MIRSSLKISASSCRAFSSSALRSFAEPVSSSTTTSSTSASSSTSTPAKNNIKKPVPLDSISSSLFLSRIPLVTPNLTEFEKLYYHYQDELQRRLMWTFPHYFYFKKSSLAERKFLQRQKWPTSKQPGVFYAKGVPDILHNRERRSKQEINLTEEQTELEKLASGGASSGASSGNGEDDVSRPIKPNSRVTESDKQNNLKSLERQLDRTLYLIVQDKVTGNWKFPSFQYEKTVNKVPLHNYAETKIQEISGKDMNLFTVTNTPIHVLRYDAQNSIISQEQQQSEVKAREYIIKSHILAGGFQLAKDAPYKDYLWLNNEELKNYLSTDYFNQVEFLLAEY